MDPSKYYPFALLASSIGVVVSVAAVIYVGRQIRTVVRNREADLLFKLYQASTTPEMSLALRIVWDLRGRTPSEEQITACEQVCVYFELIGTLVHLRYAGTNLVSGFYGSLVVGCYDSLRGYIEQMRTTPYNENFALNFERLRNRVSSELDVSRAPGQHRLAIPPKQSKPLFPR